MSGYWTTRVIMADDLQNEIARIERALLGGIEALADERGLAGEDREKFITDTRALVERLADEDDG